MNLFWNNEKVLFSASNFLKCSVCLEPQISLGRVPTGVQKAKKRKECFELCVMNDFCKLKFVEHLFIVGT